MNTNKKFDLYKSFLRTKPVRVVRKDNKENHICHIEMEYKIDNQHLFVNTFINEDKSYGATINNYKGQRLAKFNNPFIAKTLYEHGQRHL